MDPKGEYSKQRCYRFSFGSILELMSDIRGKVTQAHLDEFKKTSFSGLFQMFYEENWLNKSYFQKLNPAITTLIECYRKQEDGFSIGPVTLKLEAEDIALIFGLNMEGAEVDPFSGRKDLFHTKTEIFKKYFKASSSAAVSKKSIENCIRIVVEKVGEEEDFVKLLILEMACCFLFNSSSGSEIQSSFVEHLVDYKSINSISWPKTILKYFKERMLRQINGNTAAACGCVVVLLYWIAEHARIVDPIEGSQTRFPRAARWNLTEVARHLPVKLKTIQADDINKDFRGGLQEEESCLVQVRREEGVVPSVQVDETTFLEVNLNLEEEDEAKILLERNGKMKEENSKLRERLNEVEDENKELLAKIVRLEELNIKQSQEIGIKEELLHKAEKQIEEMKDEMYGMCAPSPPISSPQAAPTEKEPNTSNVKSFSSSDLPISTTASRSSQTPLWTTSDIPISTVASHSSQSPLWTRKPVLQMQCSNYEGDVDKLKNKISEQQDMINSKEAEVSKLKIEILKFQKEQNSLSLKCSSLEEQNTASQQRCKELAQRICSIKFIVNESDLQSDEDVGDFHVESAV